MDKSQLSNKAKQIIKDTEFRESKKGTDTVKVWESYREQALLWRGIALLQVVVTIISIVLALIFYSKQEIKINVPEKPLPGYYSPSEIHESEFISVATEVVNLIYSYQHQIAQRQFEEASKYIIEPMLSKFMKEMLDTQLTIIKQSRVTQLFFILPERTKVARIDDQHVQVDLVGERLKTIAGAESPLQVVKTSVVLTTIPRNAYNKYGIVVKSVELTRLER